jgi:hypothetical protein
MDIIKGILPQLCSAQLLPELRALHLPHSLLMDDILPAASVVDASSQLPNLEALHVPYLSDISVHIDAGSLPDGMFQGWSRLRELSMPVSLDGSSIASLACCRALSQLRLTQSVGGELGDVDVTDVASLVAQLPALVALGLSCDLLQGVAALQTLTRLTALSLAWLVYGDVGAGNAGQVLSHVGTLSNLRSLQLAWVCDDRQGDTGAPGWLTRLGLLTSLQLRFERMDQGEEWIEGVPADAFDDVAASVPHLPALCELHIDVDSNEHAAGLSAAACSRIASAASSLQRLHLSGLPLPATAMAEVLSQLTGLTCLSLNPASGMEPCVMSFAWLPALSALRELHYVGDSQDTCAGSVLPCQLLAGMSNIVTLSLGSCWFLDDPYLVELCTSAPQLRSLNLSDNVNIGTGLSALQHLTGLEVLGLEAAPFRPVHLEHVRVPCSLRRCYLGTRWPGWTPER